MPDSPGHHLPGMMSKRLQKASSDKALSGSCMDSSGSTWVRRSSILGVLGGAALALAACGPNTGGGTGGTGGAGGGDTGGGDTGGTGGGGQASKADKVDILFAIDNSRSMADKQAILSLALSDLLSGLANPPCLDASGQIVEQPATPLDACPPGSDRQYKPVTDIHIGVISSSIGGHGSDACNPDGAGKASNDDKAHLLDRLDPAGGGTVPTYESKGFLAWDPLQTKNPPGDSDPVAIATKFKDLVLGVGQIGCGYESQLESVYRFLVDPAPPASLAIDVNGKVVKNGVDVDLLEQRKAFLRPDSLVVVLSLSDENDCSIREEGQYYFAAQQKAANGSPFHLPAARAVCATNPNDECCYSCGQKGPTDEDGNPLCPQDPTCTGPNGTTKYLDDLTDNINLRCFDQKRRFGIDFLYPIDRYTQGFTSTTVTDANGQVVPNPLFSDLDPADANTTVRDPSLVVFAGVVGVPWQDIAKNPNDLAQGFKNAAELSQANASGQTSWDIVLGNPASNVPPLDPFMIESTSPRSGTNPVTGTAITAPGGAPNLINGTEYTISKNDDLQYACIMPVPEPRDCASGGVASCDCEDPTNDSPLCEVDPATGNPTLQSRAKAYPGLRQLGLMKSLGGQAVVGSICAGQIDNPSTPDYAYRPVVSSILANVKNRLQ